MCNWETPSYCSRPTSRCPPIPRIHLPTMHTFSHIYVLFQIYISSPTYLSLSYPPFTCTSSLIYLLAHTSTPPLPLLSIPNSPPLFKQRQFGRYFSLIMTSGAFAIPIVGYFMDTKGFPATWAATVTLGVAWSLLVLYDSQWTLLPSFVCYALFRTFLFTFLFAFIADTMGFRYFGVLAGIMFVIGGLVGLLQYPLAKWAAVTCHLATTPLTRIHCDRGNWSIVNLGEHIIIAPTTTLTIS